MKVNTLMSAHIMRFARINIKVWLSRLNFDDAQDIVTKFSSEIEESLLSGDITDYTNYVFKHKYYVIKVLKFSLEKMEIDFGIINNRALSEAR